MVLVRTVQELLGIKTKPESYKTLWASLDGQQDEPGMPQHRLCAHRTGETWSLFIEDKDEPYKYAAPLTLPFSYSANPEPIATGLSTPEMQDILRTQDPRETTLPDHISLTAKLD
ncbi:MAG: hypothetical protein WC043_04085 [Pseudobdellovibrionaceae bacterium]